jgi:Ring finger domain
MSSYRLQYNSTTSINHETDLLPQLLSAGNATTGRTEESDRALDSVLQYIFISIVLTCVSFIFCRFCAVACFGCVRFHRTEDLPTQIIIAVEPARKVSRDSLIKEELSMIHEYTFENKGGTNEECEDGGCSDCAVCLTRFEVGDRCRELPRPCGHRFHKDCIDAWLIKSARCPLCNRSILLILSQSSSEAEAIHSVNSGNYSSTSHIHIDSMG